MGAILVQMWQRPKRRTTRQKSKRVVSNTRTGYGLLQTWLSRMSRRWASSVVSKKLFSVNGSGMPCFATRRLSNLHSGNQGQGFWACALRRWKPTFDELLGESLWFTANDRAWWGFFADESAAAADR